MSKKKFSKNSILNGQFRTQKFGAREQRGQGQGQNATICLRLNSRGQSDTRFDTNIRSFLGLAFGQRKMSRDQHEAKRSSVVKRSRDRFLRKF